MAVNFAGKYVYEKSEHVVDFLKAVGITEDVIQKHGKLSDNLEVKVNGNSVTIKSDSEKSFELGKEFVDKMIDGTELKSVAKLDGKKLVITSTKPDGVKKGGRTYELTSDGLVVILSAEGVPVVGKRYYKKA